jgi:penicillin amidase
MRIRELLDATPQHTVQSFASIQLDQQSLPGMELAHLVADLPLADELEIQARDTLAAWDGDVNPDSVAASIYATLRYHLERQAYAHMHTLRIGLAGRGLFQISPGEEALNRRALPGILARIKADRHAPDTPAWPGADRSWQAILQESMHLAVNELRQVFGPDVQQWHYSRMHSLTLRHALGRTSMLAPIFNRGGWPVGGDIDTICTGYMPRVVGREPFAVLPSYRQICDTSDWDASICVLLSGQSGHPASRHYTDMTALWLRGEYHPMLWSRSLVEQHTASTLLLEPENHSDQ